VRAVVDDGVDSGVAAGGVLLRLADAVHAAWRQADAAPVLALAGDAVAELGDAAFCDAVGVAAGFNAITRIADATGIPLEAASVARAGDVRERVGIAAFAAAKAAGG
jgi:hypothetical protein